MDVNEIIAALRRMKVNTGSLVCLGCGHEHNCGVRGCAILREAADALERMNDFDQTKSRKMMEKLQKAQYELDIWKRGGWFRVELLKPEPVRIVLVRMKTGKTGIGFLDLHKDWFVNRVRTNDVTHWRPLPDPPKEDEA